MNITVCRTTDVDLELDKLTSLDEGYETTPILAITPIPQRPDEEELHAQFEEALYARINAFGSHLQYLGNKPSSNHNTQRVFISSSGHNVQRFLIYFCAALSCMSLGFDLMGLLVLHMR